MEDLLLEPGYTGSWEALVEPYSWALYPEDHLTSEEFLAIRGEKLCKAMARPERGRKVIKVPGDMGWTRPAVEEGWFCRRITEHLEARPGNLLIPLVWRGYLAALLNGT